MILWGFRDLVKKSTIRWLNCKGPIISSWFERTRWLWNLRLAAFSFRHIGSSRVAALSHCSCWRSPWFFQEAIDRLSAESFTLVFIWRHSRDHRRSFLSPPSFPAFSSCDPPHTMSLLSPLSSSLRLSAKSTLRPLPCLRLKHTATPPASQATTSSSSSSSSKSSPAATPFGSVVSLHLSKNQHYDLWAFPVKISSLSRTWRESFHSVFIRLFFLLGFFFDIASKMLAMECGCVTTASAQHAFTQRQSRDCWTRFP